MPAKNVLYENGKLQVPEEAGEDQSKMLRLMEFQW